MRVVLDTNVLISDTFWTGNSFKILRLVDKGKLKLILSKEILEEYDHVVHIDEILEKSAYREDRVDVVRQLLSMVSLVNLTIHVQIIS
ncbi:MAG: putative toxin-antitoxin system toxin component, PIN family [Nanoarchaeota archaeon]